MKYFILLVTMMGLLSCNHKAAIEIKEGAKIKTFVKPPHIVIMPYEDFSIKEAQALQETLKEEFGRLLPEEVIFSIATQESLPVEAYIKSRRRYDALKILFHERTLVRGNEVIIGVTHKDICANVHNVKDYGIIGRALLGKQVCIVSDRRLSDKTKFWKPILHEYLHTYYLMTHCPNNDPYCIMQNCAGKGNFKIKNTLCFTCKTKLLK